MELFPFHEFYLFKKKYPHVNTNEMQDELGEQFAQFCIEQKFTNLRLFELLLKWKCISEEKFVEMKTVLNQPSSFQIKSKSTHLPCNEIENKCIEVSQPNESCPKKEATIPITNHISSKTTTQYCNTMMIQDTLVLFIKESTDLILKNVLSQPPHHNSSTTQHTELGKNLDHLCSSFKEFIGDIMMESNQRVDGYRIEELYYKYIVKYVTIPELRILWNSHLAAYHQQKNQFCEAADCLLRILCIVFRILKLVNDPIVDNIPLELLSNGVASGPLQHVKEEEIASSLTTSEPFVIPKCYEFTVEGILSTSQKICDLYEQAEYYEKAVDVYKFMLPFVERIETFYFA